MTDPISWPVKTLPPRSIMFSRQLRSVSGGMSLSGIEQVVQSALDYWRARITVDVVNFDQVLQLRAMLAASDGRFGTWLIPSCSGFQTLGPPRALGVLSVVGVPTIVDSPFADSSTFTDSGAFETRMVLGNLVSDAAIGARSVVVQMQSATPQPLAGQFFSIGQYLYSIATSIPVTPDDTADGVTLTFRPGLRAAALAGAEVDFSRPQCLMRLAKDDAGEMDLDFLRFARSLSLDFVEVVP